MIVVAMPQAAITHIFLNLCAPILPGLSGVCFESGWTKVPILPGLSGVCFESGWTKVLCNNSTKKFVGCLKQGREEVGCRMGGIPTRRIF